MIPFKETNRLARNARETTQLDGHRHIAILEFRTGLLSTQADSVTRLRGSVRDCISSNKQGGRRLSDRVKISGRFGYGTLYRS